MMFNDTAKNNTLQKMHCSCKNCHQDLTLHLHGSLCIGFPPADALITRFSHWPTGAWMVLLH